MYSPNLKSVALAVPEIIGGTQKIWTAPGYAHAPLSPKFLTGFYLEWPCKYIPKILKSVALPVPEIRGVAKLQTPSFEEGEAVGVGDGTVRKSIGEFLWAVHSNFSSIFTRFRDIAAFVLQHATFTLPHSYSG